MLSSIYVTCFSADGQLYVLPPAMSNLIYSYAPCRFPNLLVAYLSRAFDCYRKAASYDRAKWIDGDDEEDQEDTSPHEMIGFGSLCERLRDLGCVHMLQDTLRHVINAFLEQKIPQPNGRFSGEFEEPQLSMLCEWVQCVAAAFVEIVLGSDMDKEMWLQNLDFSTNLIFAKLRISELFNITRFFPESIPALKDLQASVHKTDLNEHLCSAMRCQLSNRLLQAGASTDAIISTYIHLVKALRVYDPSSVTLEAVTGPTMSYLRSRSDTIRCIIRSLTEDSESELFKELCRPRAGPIQEDYESDDDAGDDDDSWEPDPISADPSKSSKSRCNTDIISMLVNIYGSKELFVSEYRTMLAEKLLNAPIDSVYDTENELQSQEYLKLRFGEESLEVCDFMLADVVDSERINRSIHEKLKALNTPCAAAPDSEILHWIQAQISSNKSSHFCKYDMNNGIDRAKAIEAAREASEAYLSSTIITRLCWPVIPEEEPKLPCKVQAVMDLYNEQYHSLKAPRKLIWKPSLGSVDVELQLADRTLNLKVTPLQATLLALFEEKSDWSLEDLAKRTGIDEAVVEKRIAYLVSQRVLEEQRCSDARQHIYQVLETLPAMNTSEEEDVDMVCADDEGEDERGSAPQLDPQWEKIQSYVTGMLNVHGSTSLDRIHNMLRMFVSDPPYDRSIDELREYLGSLADADVLDCSNDHYSVSGK